MKFTVAGNKVICSRIDNTVPDQESYRRVVEFDAQVESIPPHVVARLTSREVEELKAFINDRKRIEANPAEQNMLEALPGLLREAKEVLSSVESINKDTYEKLFASVAELGEALDSVRPSDQGQSTPVENMRHSEAQKTRLDGIKHVL
jgi:hypothetical protein